MGVRRLYHQTLHHKQKTAHRVDAADRTAHEAQLRAKEVDVAQLFVAPGSVSRTMNLGPGRFEVIVASINGVRKAQAQLNKLQVPCKDELKRHRTAAIQVWKGTDYLRSQPPLFVLRDQKSENVLLRERGTVSVMLCRHVNSTESSIRSHG